MFLKENVRYLRKKKNLSQDELASMLGFKSFTTIQKWESGAAEPSFKTTAELAKIFGVTVGQLATEDLSSCIVVNAKGLSEEQQSLVDSFESLSMKGKDKLLSYLSDLLELYHK